jgi:plastocyanin
MQFRHSGIVIVACVACLSACAGCGESGSNTPKAAGKSPATSEPARVDSGKPKSAGTAASGDTSAPAKEPASGTPIDGPVGTIAGVTRFVGDQVPGSTIVLNTTDPLVCGAEMSKRDQEISAENKGIRNVLVWLEDVQLPDGYKPPRQDMVLDNKNCQFEPHAAAITVGSTIEATNSDDVFHTTNLDGAASENIPLVSKGSSQTTMARRTGIIRVKCDKHGWMQAFIRVDPHPFHAVTDENGEFSIANVPVGTYKLKFWHEVFYDQDMEITVKANETSTLEIKYPTADQN